MAAAPAIMIAASAASALGAIGQANSQAAMLQSQSATAQYNARIAEQQAKQAVDVSVVQQLAQRRQARQVLGNQRAAIAQSGVGAGGSNRDILERSETLAELDALNLAYEGTVKSRGYLAQRDIDEFQASVYQSQIGPTKRAGALSAIGSIGLGLYGARNGRVA